MAASHVQTLTPTDETVSGTSVAMTPNAPTTQGNLLVVAVEAQGNDVIDSVTDTQGNTWVVDSGIANGTVTGLSLAYTFQDVAGLSITDTITAHLTSSPAKIIGCDEFSGILSKDSSTTSSGTDAAPTVTGAAASQADTLFYCAVAYAGAAGFTPNADFTLAYDHNLNDTGVNRCLSGSYKIASAVETPTYGGSLSSSRQWAIIGISFAAAAGGGGSPQTMDVGKIPSGAAVHGENISGSGAVALPVGGVPSAAAARGASIAGAGGAPLAVGGVPSGEAVRGADIAPSGGTPLPVGRVPSGEAVRGADTTPSGAAPLAVGSVPSAEATRGADLTGTGSAALPVGGVSSGENVNGVTLGQGVPASPQLLLGAVPSGASVRGAGIDGSGSATLDAGSIPSGEAVRGVHLGAGAGQLALGAVPSAAAVRGAALAGSGTADPLQPGHVASEEAVRGVTVAPPAEASSVAVRSITPVQDFIPDAAITLDMPPLVEAGDLLLVEIYWRTGSGDLNAPPPGWTEIPVSKDGTISRTAVLWKIADGTEAGAQETFTWATAPTGMAGGAVAVAGADTTAPINASAGGNSAAVAGTAVTLPDITTTVDGCLLFGFAGISNATTFTPPTGYTEAWDGKTLLGTSNGALTAAYKAAGAAGATGTEDFIAAGSGRWATVHLAVAPAPPQPAKIQQRGTATFAETGGTTLTLDVPAGVISGDLLIARVGMGGAPPVATPDGWTLLHSGADGTVIGERVYWKIAGPGEAASVDFVATGGTGGTGHMTAWLNVDATTPILSYVARNSGGTAGTRPKAGGVTTPNTSAVMLAMVSANGSGSFTPPTGYAELGDGKTILGTAAAGSVAWEYAPSEGAQPDQFFTYSVSARWVTHHLVLNPAIPVDTGGGSNAFEHLGFSLGNLADKSAAYIADALAILREICGAGALVRTDLKFTLDSTGNSTISWTKYDAFADACAAAGVQWYPCIHYAQPGGGGYATPVLVGDDMVDWQADCESVVARYADGGTYSLTAPAGWIPMDRYELWNEPQTGTGDAASRPNADGDMRVPENIYRMLRDGSAGLKAGATALGLAAPLIVGPAIGAIDVDVIKAVLDVGVTRAVQIDAFIDRLSFHMYMHTDPYGDPGSSYYVNGQTGTLKQRTARSIGSELRPLLADYGLSALELEITEGGYSGSDRWNQYQVTYNGVTATGHAARDDVWRGPSSPGKQAGELDQQTATDDFFALLEENALAWKVKVVTFYNITDNGVNWTSAGDYEYWQQTRGWVDYNATTGTWTWKPAAFSFQKWATATTSVDRTIVTDSDTLAFTEIGDAVAGRITVTDSDTMTLTEASTESIPPAPVAASVPTPVPQNQIAGGANTDRLTLTWGQTTQPGSLLVLTVAVNTAIDPFSLTPPDGWIAPPGLPFQDGQVIVGVWYKPNAPRESGDVTVQLQDAKWCAGTLQEYRGIQPVDTLDVVATRGGHSETPALPFSAKTAKASELWLGVIAQTQNVLQDIVTNPDGFTQALHVENPAPQSGAKIGHAVYEKVATAEAAPTLAVATNPLVNTGWASVLVTFRGTSPDSTPQGVYSTEIQWSAANRGAFTIGRSVIGGPDGLAGYFGGSEFDDLSEDLQEITIVRGRTQPYGDMAAGQASVRLRDLTGKYNPKNSGSPLRNLLEPMRPGRIRCLYDGQVFPLYEGFLTDEGSKPARDSRFATMEFLDGFEWLERTSPVIAATGETTTGAAIGLILDATAWTGVRNLAVGDVLPDFSADGSVTALQLISDLLAVERGVFFFDKAGVPTYHDRNHRSLVNSLGVIDNDMGDVEPGISVTNVQNKATVQRQAPEPVGDATPEETVPQVYVDAQSAQRYGTREAEAITSPYLRDDAQAMSLARFIVARRKTPLSPVWTLDLDARSPEVFYVMLTADLGDRVLVVENQGGTVADCIIEGVEHSIREAGKYHHVRWILSERGGNVFVIGRSRIEGRDFITY